MHITFLYYYSNLIVFNILVLPFFQNDYLSLSKSRGKEIYKEFCENCHKPDGKGIKNTFPPLAQSDFLLNNNVKSIRAIKFGQSGSITVNGIFYNNTMPNPKLLDEEIADVMNYILHSWGNTSKTTVTEKMVKSVNK